MYQTIKYEVKDKVATVTINRPEALNALNSTVLDELFDVFNVIDKDDEVRCVIVTGEGRSFVAGADIAEMSTLNPVEGKRFAQKGHRVMNFIEKTEKPVIAAVNGFALGGGIRKGGVRTTGSRSWHYTGIWRHAEIIQDCGTWQRGDADSDRAEHQSGRGTADRTGAEGSRAGRTDADSGSDGEENRLQRAGSGHGLQDAAQ